MRARSTLRRRILRWLLAYVVLLSLAVLAGGYYLHQRVEQVAWEAVLRTELDYHVQRAREVPSYAWRDTDTLRMFGVPGTPDVPNLLRGFPDGLHDDLLLEGVASAVLIDHIDGLPVAIALDLTSFEAVEGTITGVVAAATFGLILVVGLLVMWRLGRAIQPLAVLAGQVQALDPDASGQRLQLDPAASAEVQVISDAFNDYLDRNAQFVQRERTFIASASHELRTPIAVIAGAAELVLDQADIPTPARMQVARIQRTARNVEPLIAVLLVLAKDPARLKDSSEQLALHELLAEIVEDHRYLTTGKDLQLVVEPLPSCEILAPLTIVQAAVGNLLRNAIESSDTGEVHIQLLPDATVVIEDPGHGMSPEQISALYARVARGGRDGGGIGLDLIARLCDHLGWGLHFSSMAGRGTRTTLRLHPEASPTTT